MKTKLTAIISGLAGLLNLAAPNASADLEVSASVSIHAQADFYAPLAPNGAWVEVGSYGRCWRPAGVAVDWRPYCAGHWVWTDCGWYWESDEPWGWACYHYGCWAYDPVQAWIWVPGIEWAPAWVSWRVGGGYIGWAPLAPRGVVVAGPQFVFVADARFQEPVRRSTVIVNNTTIINKTTVINNTRRETRQIGGAGRQQVVVNEGPGLEIVQKATGHKVQATPIQEVARQTRVPADVGRKPAEFKAHERVPAGQIEQPTPAPKHQSTPPGTYEKPVPRKPPGRDEPPRAERQQPAPTQPAARPQVPRPEKDPGKPHDRQGDGHGNNKPTEPKEPKKDQ